MKGRASLAEMSDRQTRVLAYIRIVDLLYGRAPSLSEIQRHLGMKSRNSASQLVTRMWRRKLVERSLSGELQLVHAQPFPKASTQQ